MRFADAEGTEYRIVFDHQPRGTGAGTICTIEMLERPLGEANPAWEVIATGEAKLRSDVVMGPSPTLKDREGNPLEVVVGTTQDVLHRPLGRELSLTRAVAQLGKELRGRALSAYFGEARKAQVPEWGKRLLQAERKAWR